MDDPNSQFYIYHYDVDFKSFTGSARFENPMIFNDFGIYASFGVGSKETILAGVKEKVEEAIADYLKANFDL